MGHLSEEPRHAVSRRLPGCCSSQNWQCITHLMMTCAMSLYHIKRAVGLKLDKQPFSLITSLGPLLFGFNTFVFVHSGLECATNLWSANRNPPTLSRPLRHPHAQKWARHRNPPEKGIWQTHLQYFQRNKGFPQFQGTGRTYRSSPPVRWEGPETELRRKMRKLLQTTNRRTLLLRRI